MDLRSNPCVTSAEQLIEISKRSGTPVWVHAAVRDILAEHPDCGLTEEQLANIIRDLVIEQRWALGQ